MILPCTPADLPAIGEIINDAALAYKGVIPADRWQEPYMSAEELRTQIEQGVQFWGYQQEEELLGVMGIQNKGPVTLIRHAYVQSRHRNKGIGGKLLTHLTAIASTPILIGTWAEATWAVAFYEQHGFRLVSSPEKEALLVQYWTIPVRQIETSVVLASTDWQGWQQTLGKGE
jgi:GNAT superfamily N-acetyltransferase